MHKAYEYIYKELSRGASSQWKKDYPPSRVFRLIDYIGLQTAVGALAVRKDVLSTKQQCIFNAFIEQLVHDKAISRTTLSKLYKDELSDLTKSTEPTQQESTNHDSREPSLHGPPSLGDVGRRISFASPESHEMKQFASLQNPCELDRDHGSVRSNHKDHLTKPDGATDQALSQQSGDLNVSFSLKSGALLDEYSDAESSYPKLSEIYKATNVQSNTPAVNTDTKLRSYTTHALPHSGKKSRNQPVAGDKQLKATEMLAVAPSNTISLLPSESNTVVKRSLLQEALNRSVVE